MLAELLEWTSEKADGQLLCACALCRLLSQLSQVCKFMLTSVPFQCVGIEALHAEREATAKRSTKGCASALASPLAGEEEMRIRYQYCQEAPRQKGGSQN